MKISMKLDYQYIVIFFNFSPTLNHLHPLQVENCNSNSRLVVDEDGNGKFRLERVKERGAKLHLTIPGETLKEQLKHRIILRNVEPSFMLRFQERHLK